MSGMMLSAKRLEKLLNANGFALRDWDKTTKSISFVRPAAIPRLFEHLLVHGQGKRGEAVYAVSSASGSRNVAIDPCIAEEDQSLMFALESDSDRHWTLVANSSEAKEWESKLSRSADAHCRATTMRVGQSLVDRLSPIFEAVRAYLEHTGDPKKILEREFQYVSTSLPTEGRKKVADLMLGMMGYYPSEDLELACISLVRFANSVELSPDHLWDKKTHENPELRARLILLTDYFQEVRSKFTS